MSYTLGWNGANNTPILSPNAPVDLPQLAHFFVDMSVIFLYCPFKARNMRQA